MINVLMAMCGLVFIIILKIVFTLIKTVCFGWTKVVCEVIATDKDYTFIADLKGTDMWAYPNHKYRVGAKILATIDKHRQIKKIQMI